jgi:DNA primase
LDIKNLKSHLSQHQEKIISILEKLDFHHIKLHQGSEDNYITCGNPDGGNNPTAITIYLSDSLLTIDYTREISKDKLNCDFIDLICFFRPQYNFFENLKWISEEAGVDYYHNFEGEQPQLLKTLELIKDLLNKNISNDDEDDTPIKPKDEKILTYYLPYVSEMFLEDGIDYGTQRIFEIGYDPFTERITLPIRDEIANLVGIKSRYFYRNVPEDILKYYYIEKCPRGKILYGYYLTKDYIKESDHVLIGEAEKSTMQMWSYGYKNCVSTGGTKLSQTQIEKLSRLNKRLIFCFDSDFDKKKIQDLRNKFLEQIDFWAIVDEEGLLKDKESPSDNYHSFQKLIDKHVYEIKKEI